MNALRTAALLLLVARAAHAQPATEVEACPFDGASLAAAIALEDQAAGRRSSGTVHVTCAPDGTASVRVETAARTGARDVDLTDVPASLAPRVIALVAVTLLHEPPAPPAPSPPSPAPSPSPSPSLSPSLSPSPSPSPSPPSPSPSPPADAPTRAPSRPHLLSTPLSLSAPLGVSARALARVHERTSTLFGVALSLTSGAASVGLSAASARIEHELGTLTPVLVAAHANVAILCAGATCLSVDGELGGLTVHASATDPMAVASRDLSAIYAHGAVELSLAGRLAGVDVAAIASLGTSRGVVARVDTEAAAVLAGWTLGAALEVRR